MDWDDLKVFLALSRKGSARGAAQELGVSNSTVTRRLDDMEHKLQAQLFDRTPDGYRMTATGEQVLPTAEHVEELVMGVERKITGGDRELQGAIRLSLLMSDALRYKMGMGYVPCFMARATPDLVRVPGAAIVHQSDMWVLTHKDLRLSARLRVLREIIAEEFDKVRDQLDSRLA